MKNKVIKQKLIFLVETAHRRIFKEEMSDTMREFLGNLSWSFFGGITAGGIMFVVQVLAGRMLGPEEYGKINLILVISQVFMIPLLWGMDLSSARFIAKVRKSEIKKYITTAFYFVVCSVVIGGTIIFLARGIIANLFSVNLQFILWALFLSIILVFKMLLDGQIRGLNFFKYQTIAKVIEAIIISSVFLTFIFLFKIDNYTSLIMSLGLGWVVITIVYFKKIKKYFVKEINIKTLKRMLNYSKYVVMAAVTALVLGQGDKIIINKFLGTYELGIYMAYYTAAVTFVGQLASIISNVFFPMISKISNKIVAMKKIDKLLFVGFIPFFLFLNVIIFIVIKIFGNAYPIIFNVLILFGLLGTLQFFTTFYANIVNVHSEKTFSWGIGLFIVRSIIYIIFVILLVIFHKFNVINLLIGLIVNYMVDIQNLRFIIKKYATI